MNKYLIVLGIGLVLVIIGIILMSIHTQFGPYGLLLAIWASFFILGGIITSIVGLILSISHKSSKKPMISQKTKFCTQCGNPVPNGVKFCTKCGKEIQL